MKNRITKSSFQLFIFITCFGISSLMKAQPTHPNHTGLAGAGIDRNKLPSSTQMIFTTADNGKVISDLKFDGQVKLDGTEGITFKRCWFISNGGIAAIRDKYKDNPRNTTFEDCDFGAHGYDQWASSANIINMSGINHFRRCLVYNSADGIKFEHHSVNYLEDCWIQPIARADKHTDCTQLNDNHVAEVYFTRCTFEKRTWTFDGVVAHSLEELDHADASIVEVTEWGNATLQTKPCGSAGCTEIIPGAYYSFESCIITGGNYIITAEKQPGRFVNNILIRGTSNTNSSSLREVKNFDDISGNLFHDDGTSFTSGNLGQNKNPTPIPFLSIVGIVDDTETPGIPGTPVANYISDQTIELSWEASTDNIGVMSYNVYINGGTPAKATSNSITLSDLTALTEYTFTISALDAKGNESEQSSGLTVSTAEASPEGPEQINVTGLKSSNNDPADEAEIMDEDFDTRWASDGDEKWISFEFDGEYEIDAIEIAFYKGDERSAIFDIQVSDDGNSWTTIYSGTSNGATVDMEMFDLPNKKSRHLRYLGHGNSESTWNAMTEIIIYGTSIDTEPPAVPTGLSSSNISTTGIDLSWDASNDNVAVTGYKVYINGTDPVSISGTNISLTDLSSSTEYKFTVSAIDAKGNESEQSAELIVAILDNIVTNPDTESPTVPTGLSSSNISTTGFDLSWDASNDNVAVTGYKVYINGTDPVSITGTNISFSDLPSSTEYKFTVSAIDAESNESEQSAEIIVSTLDLVTKIAKGDEIKFNVQVYPNPAGTNHCTILFKGFANDENVSLHIFDMSGRIVYQTQISTSQQGEYILDISNQGFKTKGIYIISAKSQSISKNVKLIVK